MASAISQENLHLFQPRPVLRGLIAPRSITPAKENRQTHHRFLDSKGSLVRSFEGSADAEKKRQRRRGRWRHEESPARPGRKPTHPQGPRANALQLGSALSRGQPEFEGLIMGGAQNDQGRCVPGYATRPPDSQRRFPRPSRPFPKFSLYILALRPPLFSISHPLD